jgi:SAM-dependent methyltransferase
MKRLVQPEWLDELPAADPRAIRSRGDLRRVNAWMGNAAIIARALRQAFPRQAPRRLVEIGAGDGQFLLSVARRFRAGSAARPPDGRSCSAVLVDRLALPIAELQQHFQRLHWTVHAVRADVFDYFENGAEAADVVVANLFLHHFLDERLEKLLRLAREKAPVVIAVEPRRSRPALLCSRWLGWMGCSPVTCHDAVASVRAGFSGSELSALWRERGGWRLSERRAGFFSHLFTARREN